MLRPDDDGRCSTRSRWRSLAWGAVAAATVTLGACGGSGESEGGDGGGDTTVSFIYAGPLHDGGFNESMAAIADSVSENVSGVEVTNTDNVPFTARASRVLDQLVASGTDMIVDAAGVADQTIETCEANPDLACLTIYPQGELPKNVGGWSYDWWGQEYVQGVTAGLLMNEDPDSSNTIGYVQSFEIPLTFGVVNANLLGCQSVNPDCQMRLININNYYDPPTSTQAAETLADTGIDMLNTWVNDTSVCQVAERRGLPTFGHFYDYADSCPESMVRSALQQGEDWFQGQVEDVADGTWKPETPILPLEEGSSWFSDFGESVPESVRTETEQVTAEIQSGELDPFAGPIRDQNGKVQVEAGDSLSPEFIYSEWDWYVDGVTSSTN